MVSIDHTTDVDRGVERGYNVARWTEIPTGGHLAAWEEPQLLAGDIREYFRAFRVTTASGMKAALAKTG